MPDPNPIVIHIGDSHEAAQPFVVRIYDSDSDPYTLMAFSETYHEEAGARNMAEAVVAGSTTYQTLVGDDGQTYWHVRSTNGEILARSSRGDNPVRAMYTMTKLEHHAPGARIVPPKPDERGD